MQRTKSWRSLWLMKLLGLSLLLSGCVKSVISVPPEQCPPFGETEYEQYLILVHEESTPQLRAWIREASRACRANELIMKELHK